MNPAYTYAQQQQPMPQPSLYDARTMIVEDKVENLQKQVEMLQRQLEFVQTLYLKQQPPAPVPAPSATALTPLQPHVPTLQPTSVPSSPKPVGQKGGAAQAAHASVTTTASPAAMSSRRTIV